MNFDFQPTLKGKLLELRPICIEDFEPLYMAANDPLIWQQHPAKDRYKREVFQAYFEEGMKTGSTLVAIDRQTNGLIGSSRYYGFDEAMSQVEIGWTFLARKYWGGSYNGEMKKLMIEHAGQYVNNIIFIIGAENIRSQRAVLKLGAVLVRDDLFRHDTVNHIYRLNHQTHWQEGS